MKNITLTLLFFFAVLFTSCDPSQRAYQDLEDFAGYLEENSAAFTDEDWTNAEAAYSAIIDEVDAQIYTDEELMEIGRLKGKCAAQLAKRTIEEAGAGLNNLMKQAEGFVEGFLDAISSDSEQ